MPLQGANADVEHVNDVIVRREAGARLVTLAIQREVIVMPFTILFVVSNVLEEGIRVGIRIGLADAVFDRVGPGGDAGERFARLQNLSDPLSGSSFDTQRSDLADGLVTIVAPGKSRSGRTQKYDRNEQQG
jgi:hypothetical protein